MYNRNLNAFLNSGEGGTAYLGVVDDGKVHGINMTRLQVGHTFCQTQFEVKIRELALFSKTCFVSRKHIIYGCLYT